MSGVKLGGRESDLTIPECGFIGHAWYSLVSVYRAQCRVVQRYLQTYVGSRLAALMDKV